MSIALLKQLDSTEYSSLLWPPRLMRRTRNFQVAGSNLTAGHLQATLSKLLTYGAQINSVSYPLRDGK